MGREEKVTVDEQLVRLRMTGVLRGVRERRLRRIELISNEMGSYG